MPEKVALRKLMNEVASASSLQAVYESALRCLHETLAVRRAAVLVLDDAGVMRFAAWMGLSEPYRRAVEGRSPWRLDEPDPAPVLIQDVEGHRALESLGSVIERERIRALAFIPLRFGPKLLGKFMLYYSEPHRFSTNEVTIAETIAGHVAFALEHHRIAAQLETRLEAERRARRSVEQAETFVAEASRELATTLEPDKTVEQLTRLVVPRLADWCVVFNAGEDGLVPFEVADGDPVKVELGRQLAARWSTGSGRSPLTDAVMHGRATVTSRIDRSRLAAETHDEEQLGLLESLGLHSAVTVPLRARGRVLGAVMLLTAESKRVYDEADLGIATEIASWAALAMDNATLYGQALSARGAAERARERLQLLARVSNDLATSLDPEQALQQLAEHLVTELADYCITYWCEGSTVRRLGLAHRDPAKLPLVEALAAAGSPSLDDAAGAGAVIRTGEDVLAEEVTEAMLERGTLNARHLEAVRALLPCSTIIVALRARGATLGAIALVTTTDSNRRYDAEDLELARELASRAALLIDNARLFARANAAIRDRDDMIAVVSHDLRSPLQSISTAAAMLELDTSTERRMASADTIKLALSRIEWLLTDLLDMSRIDSGRLTIDAAVTDVGSLLEEAGALFRPLAHEQSVRFDCTIADAMPSVNVDRGRILQVLSNLLGNALKFVHAGGHIRLSATHERDRVRIAVTDDGVGIGADELPHVFERFWRGKHHGHPGAGLGLAVAKGIVEAHGGVLSVDSRAGQGTTFAFLLDARRLAPSFQSERLGPTRAAAATQARDLESGTEERTSNGF